MENINEIQGLYIALKFGIFGAIFGFVFGSLAMRSYLLDKFDLKRR